MRGANAVADGLATRELRLYVLASGAMSLALWSFTVVLAIAAYQAGGTAAVALAVLARVLPGAVAGPFTALLADRHARRSVLLALTGGTTTALAALAALSALGGPLALVLVLAAACSVLTSGQQPALSALLPSLARTPRQLAVTNSLRQGAGNAAYCLGALAGGAAAAGLSPAAGFALSLTASAIGLLALLAMTPDPRPAHRDALAGRGTLAELALGLREVRRGRELRLSIGMHASISGVYGTLDVLMVVVAVQLVGLGTGGVGVLNSAWGAGGTAGGFAALALLARGRFSSSMNAGAALIAVPLALVAAAAHPLAAIAGFAVLGAGYALIDTASQTLVQRLASDESLARAFGVLETAGAVAVALGSALAPLLIELLGIRAALVVAALLVPVAVVARRRALLALDASAVVPERELEALRAVDVFAPLPLATIETLALRSLPRVVFADEQVLLRGDISTRFYVIAQGTFEVQAGPVVRELGPGDYFGEIALLRDVARTAAVVAETDGLLYVLARPDFLSAVTGHARAAQTAERVAAARLRASAV